MLHWVSPVCPPPGSMRATQELHRVFKLIWQKFVPISYPTWICLTGQYRISLALMTVHPWLMSHYAMALSPCLNKPRGLKHFAKLEPDPGPSWALSGHTNHGIRLYSPTNAQKSQSSISKTSVDSNRCMWSSKSFWKEQFRRYHRHKQSDFYHG